jgi:hypothetical protein
VDSLDGNDETFDSIDSFCRQAHLEKAHILRARSLRDHGDLHVISGTKSKSMAGIFSPELSWVFFRVDGMDNAGSQRMFDGGAFTPTDDGLAKFQSIDGALGSDLHFVDRQAGILANQRMLCPRWNGLTHERLTSSTTE